MLELVRKGNDVYHNGTKLTRVDQATKGPGNEVIKIVGLEGSNGAKWISLSKLQEGLNKVEVSAKQVTSTGSYTLTPQEKAEVDKLQARIDEIKTQARERYVPKPKFVDPTSLTPEQRETEATRLEAYLKALRG
jgi:hypothetical protein